MGCDGGTIPKRDELVRTKKKPEQKDKASDLAFKWRHCAISQETLVQPIMACELGRLYNKESVLEFLIDRSKFEFAARFEHLRGLKDLKELKLTDNPAAKSEQHAEKGGQGCYIDMQVSDYICPVSNFEMNGTHRFCFLWSCGCVMSGRALKEIKAKSCHKCGKAFTDNDKVILNGSEEETTENKYKMDYRRVQAKLAKKAKKAGKHSVPEETSTAEDGASSSKKSRVDPEPSTSGASNSSKLTNGTTTHKSKLAIGSSGDSKLTNGKLTNGRKGEAKVGKSSKTIQDDPKASTVYKGLFTTCERAKRQTQGPWVTFNPQYF
ncbi:replication termination factor 2-like [Littorina saxatilis]|uniref:replication termination factor 2-like n=1 Tax=Littorina saxatilis TaxID=31220 RepID=UPI0038B436ED